MRHVCALPIIYAYIPSDMFMLVIILPEKYIYTLIVMSDGSMDVYVM